MAEETEKTAEIRATQEAVGSRLHPIELIIAEKNPLLLSSLIKLFAGDERFALVATAPDGERFLSAVEQKDADVGIIGWDMPYLDGRGVLRTLYGRERAPRIIVYTGVADADVPRQAMAMGAVGFCSKAEPPAQLVETVAAAAAGRMMFPFVDVSRLAIDPFSGLTPRERELLGSLADGLTNAQIAGRLEISLNTVKFHLKNVYEKLSVSNRAQAVACYLRGGVVR